ncbi:acetylornithine transaminase [Microaerobacter geothermalis]|nr:acetylornithine transaminase [Microaerobacter geothermalis]
MMSALFETYSRWPVKVIRGQGNYLWDVEEKKYLDFTSGIGVTNLGHQPPSVKKAVEKQLEQLWHCSNLFHIPIQEKLAEKLTEISGCDKVFFCNSGAEANEAAIKLARKYAQSVLQLDRYEVITFTQSFHGRTMATLTATGQDKVKLGFSPLLPGIVTIPYNDLSAFEAAVNDRTCAVLLEVIQGEGGVNPAEKEWLQQVTAICKEKEILLMVDEIQTGMGRTGTWFAYQQYGIEPDVVTVAKGLGSGFPIGAMMAKKKTSEAFGPGSHGSTFGGNPLAVSAALATVRTIEEEGILLQVKQKGFLIQEKLRNAFSANDKIEKIKGLGLMIGIQLKEDSALYITKAREKGLLALAAGPQVIRLLPPFTVTEEEINQAVGILQGALNQ